MKTAHPPPPPRWLVIAAFAAVYLIWGSTYLGIRYAVQSIPPFIMAGTRNFTAGLVLFTFARLRSGKGPTLAEWRDAAIIGGLLLMVGNGGVTWAEQVIPSSIAALIAAVTPAWIVIFDWIRPKGKRPGWLVMAGLGVGFAGVALLARGHDLNAGKTDGCGVIVLLIATLAWSFGSILSRSARKPASSLMAVAMQMTAGGGLLLILAAVCGEGSRFSFARMTPLSMGSWLYLVGAGSLIGYTAYSWLLHVTTPARLATYGYVNPLIAVLLGCTIGHEVFTRQLGIAGAMVVISVALIICGSAKKSAHLQPDTFPESEQP